MHFLFFLSEYLSHLLFLQLFVLSAHGGELLGGGANGGGVSHTPQVFLHFFSFLSEYFLHFLFLHHFALSAHGGELGGAGGGGGVDGGNPDAPVVVVPPPQAQHASSACTLATDPSARTAHHL